MLKCQKQHFEIPEDICYLNTAYMSPLLSESVKIGHKALLKKLRPYELEIDDFFVPVDQLKQSFAQLVDVDNHQRNVIIPSVSYGMANISQNIPLSENDEIVIVSEQFPSNVYPWMELSKNRGSKLITVDSPDNFFRKGDLWTEKIIDAINTRTKVVALPHVHWSEGIIFNLKAISQKVHTVGGYLIIDGTQSIGALPFSVKDIQPDALIVSGYKWLMGPYGLGIAYYGERFDDGVPFENNWINRLNSEDFASLVNYQDRYKPYSNRYGVGESSNFASIPILQYAIDKISEWTPEGIQDYCGFITNQTIAQLNEYGYDISSEGQRSNHLFGIKIPASLSADMLKETFRKNNIYVSFRGNYIRVSPFVFNDSTDLQQLCDALIHAITHSMV